MDLTKKFLLLERQSQCLFFSLAGHPLEIYGDGEQEVQLTYVEDAAKIIVDFMKLSGPFSTPFDLGSFAAVKMTVKALALLIIKLCNSKSELVFLPKRFGEFDKLELAPLHSVSELLPHYDFSTLDEGLRKTIEFYKICSEKEVLGVCS